MATVELCLDTNILIDFLKNRELGATALEKALSDYCCGVSHITNCYMERLTSGISLAKN